LIEIAKWCFVALFLLANAGVWLGVYWEGDRFPKSTQARGWRLLLISLTAELLFGGLTSAADGWISGAQQRTIEAQRGQIIALDKLVDDANTTARIAQQNAAMLGTLMTPRHLAQGQYDAIVSYLGMRPPRFAVEIQVIPSDWECREFAKDIEAALVDAGETVTFVEAREGEWISGLQLTGPNPGKSSLLSALATAQLGVWGHGKQESEVVLKVGPREPPYIPALSPEPPTRHSFDSTPLGALPRLKENP
jgi:hypothetical protein